MMKIERMCSFYASNYHLSIILLEYLKNKETQKTKIITYLQNGINEQIELLNEKYKFNITSTKEFNSTKDIENKEIKETNDMTFIIAGSIKYMQEVNEIIENKIKSFKSKKVTIINCYNYEEQCKLMDQVLKLNDKILYTTGSKVID